MDERAYYSESQTTKPAVLNCPYCRSAESYELRCERLERAIDASEDGLPPLKYFVLPGGSAQSAALHVARCVCRRAERAVLALEDAPARGDVVVYLNRLSDLLFSLSRRANVVAKIDDVPWKPHDRG